MLHALLHGKLHESNPEPERLEDALTSTVFGTLIWVEAWDVLAEWLALGSRFERGSMPVRDVWFWPRLARAEPDVVLRIDEELVVVEAKYRSGRHDTKASPDSEPAVSDQLVRQYISMTMSPTARFAYPVALDTAIADCRLVQVFLVDARRRRRARREFEESKRRLPPGADLRLATWQRLFYVLSLQSAPERWAVDLMAYLELTGLDSFVGIGRRLASEDAMSGLRSWRARPWAAGIRQAALPADVTGLVERLRTWVPAVGWSAPSGLDAVAGANPEELVQAVRSWSVGRR